MSYQAGATRLRPSLHRSGVISVKNVALFWVHRPIPNGQYRFVKRLLITITADSFYFVLPVVCCPNIIF